MMEEVFLRIEQIARSWIGTPYRHQQKLKHMGCDCLGLLIGVFEELTGKETETPPAYSPSWGEANGLELMLEAAHRYLIPSKGVPLGSVLVFRMMPNSVAKHCGILISDNMMVHAHRRKGVVSENFEDYWISRVAESFNFPGVSNG